MWIYTLVYNFSAYGASIWEFAWKSEWRMGNVRAGGFRVFLQQFWKLTNRRYPAGRHVGAADGLDLLHVPELLVVEQFVKVDDDLVEESDTFNSLVYVFRVELGEVWNACKQNSRIGSGNSC